MATDKNRFVLNPGDICLDTGFMDYNNPYVMIDTVSKDTDDGVLVISKHRGSWWMSSVFLIKCTHCGESEQCADDVYCNCPCESCDQTECFRPGCPSGSGCKKIHSGDNRLTKIQDIAKIGWNKIRLTDSESKIPRVKVVGSKEPRIISTTPTEPRMSTSIMKLLPDSCRKILLGDSTSKANKIWIVTGKHQIDGYYVEWKWPAYREQVFFKFEPDGKWIVSKCFDDVYQAMEGE